MEQKKQKTLRELNLLDRFLFSEVMEDPGTCRAVLEIILGKDIHLKESVQSEKELRTLPTFPLTCLGRTAVLIHSVCGAIRSRA